MMFRVASQKEHKVVGACLANPYQQGVSPKLWVLGGKAVCEQKHWAIGSGFGFPPHSGILFALAVRR